MNTGEATAPGQVDRCRLPTDAYTFAKCLVRTEQYPLREYSPCVAITRGVHEVQVTNFAEILHTLVDIVCNNKLNAEGAMYSKFCGKNIVKKFRLLPILYMDLCIKLNS